MDYMYTVPSDDNIKKVVVTKEMVDNNLRLEDKKDDVLTIEDKKKEKSA